MKRRDFIPALSAGVLSGTVLAAETDPPAIKRSGMKLLQKFDSPVTAMTIYRDQLVIACADVVYIIDTKTMS